MFRETQNLKDSSQNAGLTLKDNSPISLSYNKTNKLIAGLYMVTDILDKDEPIRHRLRILGTGIISDILTINSSIKDLNIKIAEVLSFLEVASSVGIISQMNANILRKEFLSLKESIDESTAGSLQLSGSLGGHISLSEFMKDEDNEIFKIFPPVAHSIGQVKLNRIGVQKGHTFMKALSDKVATMSDNKHTHIVGEKFDILKKERREEIIRIIRASASGATITDIKTKAQGALASCGEKTLQRELISMTKDHVLNKTGEKRWSRYFVS